MLNEKNVLQMKCVLHIDKHVDPNEKIIAFTDKKLQICIEKKAIRDSKKKKDSKYDQIVLPTQIDGVSGYHAKCFKYYRSITDANPPRDAEPNTEQATSQNNQQTEDEWIDVVTVPKNCIFCGRFNVKRNGKFHKPCSTTSKEQIDQITKILTASGLVEKINELSDSVGYHSFCLSKLKYENLVSQSPKKLTAAKNNWVNQRDIHFNTFEKFRNVIVEKLIDGNEVIALTDLHEEYNAMFEEEKLKTEPNSDETTYKSQHLLSKIFKAYPSLTKSVYKNRIFIHKDSLTSEEIYAKGFQQKDDWSKQIRAVAFFIRQKVIGMKKTTLPKNNITFEDVVNGECEIPSELNLLISSLMKGPNGVLNSTKERRISSICSSLIFSISNGTIKPTLSLYLGLVTKSLTGSRKMLNILNRLGHSISYTVTEGIETELAYGCAAETRLLP